MTRKVRRNAIALQILAASLTLLLFAAGLFSRHLASKAESLASVGTAHVLDIELRPHIGRPYTETMHHNAVDLFASNDATIESGIQAFKAFGTLAVQVGGIICLLSFANLFLLLRAIPREP